MVDLAELDFALLPFDWDLLLLDDRLWLSCCLDLDLLLLLVVDLFLLLLLLLDVDRRRSILLSNLTRLFA